MSADELYLRQLLYLTIRELAYVREAEHISQVSSSSGKDLIEKGMAILGVKDLSTEFLPATAQPGVPA